MTDQLNQALFPEYRIQKILILIGNALHALNRPEDEIKKRAILKALKESY